MTERSAWKGAVLSNVGIHLIVYAVMFPVGRFVMHISWWTMLFLAVSYELWDWLLIPLIRRWIASRAAARNPQGG